MPVVATGGFFTQGVHYNAGDPIPADVLCTIPKQVMAIHLEKGALRAVSDEEAKIMRDSRDERQAKAVEKRDQQVIDRTKAKIAEMKKKLEETSLGRKSALAALEKLEAKLASLETGFIDAPVEPVPEPEEPKPELVKEKPAKAAKPKKGRSRRG